MDILGYAVSFLLFIIVIAVAITIVKNFSKPPEVSPEINLDLKYACSQFNETAINTDNLRLLILAFLNGQCNSFTGTLKEKITFKEIEQLVLDFDKTIPVVLTDRCSLPQTSTRSVFICCNEILEENKVINIVQKEIKNSDILICGSK